jgi:hypothetical protein
VVVMVMMLVVMVMAAAVAIIVMVIVIVIMVMMVVLMLVVVIVIVIMVMMVVLVLVVVIVIVVVVMMVVLVLIIVIVVIMVVVATAGAVFIMLMVVVVMVVMLVLMLLVLVSQLLHLGFQTVGIHSLGNLLAGNLSPRSGDKTGVIVQTLEQLGGGQNLVGGSGVGAAHNDKVSIGNLVIKELAEVAHIHAALAGIHNSDLCANLGTVNSGDSSCHIAELAHTGGLNNYTVGSIVLHNLFQSLGKVANQSAANAARVHLCNFNAGILQKATINGNFAELIFNQYQLLALISLAYKLANKRGLTGTKKAGKYVYFSHDKFLHLSMLFFLNAYYITLNCGLQQNKIHNLCQRFHVRLDIAMSRLA